VINNIINGKWPKRRPTPADHGGPPHRHDSDGEPCL
jgi:hypothetical protein